MKYKKISFNQFMEIYHVVPRAAIDIVVVNDKGFLLTKRAIPPFKGMWHIPGGSILFKEPIQHAIDRITGEELGVKVEVIKSLGVIEYLDDDGRHTVSNGFLAKTAGGKLRGSKQGKEIKFFKRVPQNIIPDQGLFLKEHLGEIKSNIF